jgi:hypothetical protein
MIIPFETSWKIFRALGQVKEEELARVADHEAARVRVASTPLLATRVAASSWPVSELSVLEGAQPGRNFERLQQPWVQRIAENPQFPKAAWLA